MIFRATSSDADPSTRLEMPNRDRSHRLGVLALVVAMAVGACGKRGDPLPPFRRVPAAAEQFTIRQRGDDVLLAWKAPQRNRDGTIEDVSLREVEVLRRIMDLPVLLEEALENAEEVALARAEREADNLIENGLPVAEELDQKDSQPSDASLEGAPESADDEASADTPLADPPRSGVDAIAGASPEQSAPSLEQSAESESPQAEPADDSELDAADGLPDDAAEPVEPAAPLVPIPGFALEAEVIATLEAGELGAEQEFQESVDPEWVGKRVEYAVRFKNRKNRVGPLTPLLQLEPMPPLVEPGGLEAAVGDRFVELRWSHHQPEPPEGLVAGFHVYRQVRTLPSSATDVIERVNTALEEGVGSEAATDVVFGPFELVTSQLVNELAFVDPTIAFGTEYCYRVRRASKAFVEPPPPELDPLDEDLASLDLEDDPDADPDDIQESTDPDSEATEPPPSPSIDEATPESAAGQQAASGSEGASQELEPDAQDRQPSPMELAYPDREAMIAAALADFEPEFTIPPIGNLFLIESPFGDEVCVLAEDIFPPAPVSNLVAVASAGSVLLSWGESASDDVEGYFIYRLREGQNEFDRINESPITGLSHRDEDVVTGSYRYYVTASDVSDNHNESTRSEVAIVSVDELR